MGGNDEKSVSEQLTEVMAKLSDTESEHRKDRKEIKSFTVEAKSLRKENSRLREEVSVLKAKNTALEEKLGMLETENRILRDDNERMKKIPNNDSSNSSIPPSMDPPGKAPNSFHHRKATKKKPSAQRGHKGSGLSSVSMPMRVGNFRFQMSLKQMCLMAIPFSNTMSKKDLRICKNRQKMAGGFRTASG